MNVGLSLIVGLAAGFGVKTIINWLSIDGYKVKSKSIFIEIICGFIWVWAFQNLPTDEATIFSLISTILVGISLVDFHTYQIPLLFIIAGAGVAVASILIKLTYFSSAMWGIFVGAVIPLIIMGLTWLVTKRQGMGYGDIQLGIVLGAWLGPMRMAITLFGASLLSLSTWLAVSLVQDFDKDRALPLAPFLAVAGIGVYIGSIYYPGFFHLLIIQ